MEDAEYVDSLQIDNLVEHPNGEANISLNIALDENNKLSADMNDPETGGTSNANITLVSRTVEERLEPTNYELVMDSVEDEVSENAVETEELSEVQRGNFAAEEELTSYFSPCVHLVHAVPVFQKGWYCFNPVPKSCVLLEFLGLHLFVMARFFMFTDTVSLLTRLKIFG